MLKDRAGQMDAAGQKGRRTPRQSRRRRVSAALRAASPTTRAPSSIDRVASVTASAGSELSARSTRKKKPIARTSANAMMAKITPPLPARRLLLLLSTVTASPGDRPFKEHQPA
ncbi:hypothetical protein WG908_11595 [Sphingobium sp. AN641]|uniref:hypothetical protein n=1 Tax=Sphingobium sp. AN641 TaxID=3133443 RepID=UPI0030C1B40A